MTLQPAYGRDYKSSKAVLADWLLKKDFIIADVFDRYCGKPINCDDAAEVGIRSLFVHYDGSRKVCHIQQRGETWRIAR
jgi:hypothetical protein